MKKPKYTGILIRRHTIYLSSSGDQLEKQPTFEETSLDYFQGTNKFLLVELYTKVGEVAGNTQKVIFNSAYDNNQPWFDEIFLIKN